MRKRNETKYCYPPKQVNKPFKKYQLTTLFLYKIKNNEKASFIIYNNGSNQFVCHL